MLAFIITSPSAYIKYDFVVLLFNSSNSFIYFDLYLFSSSKDSIIFTNLCISSILK
nr:MAG TPA: hypothetical protein [Caudoviricetes sp.]